MKWNIGNKISGLIAVALVFLLILGSSSYLMINTLNTSIEWNTHTYKVLALNETLSSLLKDAETGQRGYIITGEEKYLEPYNKSLGVIYANLSELIELTIDNPAQQERLKGYKTQIDAKLAELKHTIDIRREKGFDAAMEVVVSDKGKTIMDEYRKLSYAFGKAENDLLQARELTMTRNVRNTKLVIIFGTLLAILALSFIGFLLVGNISKPLDNITKMAGLISEGDLRVKIVNSKRQDELGLLNNSFYHMVEKLRISITDIMEGVNLLGSSASEIMAATTQVASGSAETASAISETTTTVEEVRQAAQLSSQKASRVSENAQQVVQVTHDGQRAVEETGNGIHLIQNQMESIANTIVRLSEQSQQIGGIIASVDDVADQSNLLAVNASIEAAKAGEHGKGFAVVAQEIKNLAQMSKQATVKVRGILSDVQKATTAAVMATEQGSKAVENGVKTSAKAGESIRKLADNTSKAVEAATQIVASSQQQVIGMDQIGLAMNNINQAGTENAASMLQAERSAKDLNDLGQKLKLLVAQYKL